MIFADKLIQLRKKSGWTQEELAQQMHVSRQSVSKWEGAQSVPDLEKMVQLSRLFHVTTDYLLKDEEGEPEPAPGEDPGESLRRVSLEEASAFLEAKQRSAGPIAFATMLCVLSPIGLILLAAMSEVPKYGIPENAAAGIGMILLLLLVAAATAMFILSGSRTSSYEFLEKEPFETEYGVTGMVRERKEQFRETYVRNNVIGTCLCVLSVIPLFAGILIDEENDLLLCGMVCGMLAMIAVGVTFFIRVGTVWNSFQQLLQEGDYSPRNKKAFGVSGGHWVLVTAIYLACSFLTDRWDLTWIIWVAAAGLYSLLAAILRKRSEK